jgi:sortase B
MKKDNGNSKKDRNVWDGILPVLGIVFLLIFLVSGYYLLQYYRAYQVQRAQNEKLTALWQAESKDGGNQKEKTTGEQQNTQDSRENQDESLSSINPDFVGFISVQDTDINYPIVQRDNAYYLTHDFYGEINSHGAIFLDETCQIQDQVILIHGHHMRDGTMFGGLKQYRKSDFRKNHESIYLDWGDGERQYRIFAVALIDLTQEDYFHYEILPDTSEEKETYLKRLKSNALWYGDIDAKAEGQIVLLSTCEYGTQEQRLVVAAILND